jgi:hypothetical protein
VPESEQATEQRRHRTLRIDRAAGALRIFEGYKEGIDLRNRGRESLLELGFERACGR